VRAQVADYIEGAFGVPSRADLVYMTCGAAASLTIALKALCEKDDEFVVIAPYFPEYRVFIENAGGMVRVARADGRFRLDMGALDRAVTEKTKAVIINSPNNPAGTVYGENELKELAALLNKKSAQNQWYKRRPCRF